MSLPWADWTIGSISELLDQHQIRHQVCELDDKVIVRVSINGATPSIVVDMTEIVFANVGDLKQWLYEHRGFYSWSIYGNNEDLGDDILLVHGGYYRVYAY